jgi:hypothetical protein
MNIYRKTMIVMTAVLTLTTFSIVARNKTPDNEYKNLKVYPKNVSEEKVEHDMELFNNSLGVTCEYCHVKKGAFWDFASDEIHKKDEARDMMRMTAEINQKFFGATPASKESDLAMNCYTCHRGQEQPVIPWDTAYIKAPVASVGQ